jgi:hypothetical protein
MNIQAPNPLVEPSPRTAACVNSARRPWGARGAMVGLIAGLAFALFQPAAKAANVLPVDTGNLETTTFLLTGPMVGGETAKLQTEIEKVAAGRRITVIMDSPGGLVDEGIRLGRLFYNERIGTAVVATGGGCHSSCAIAFLGGRDKMTGAPLRIMMSGSKLGFHQTRQFLDNNRTYSPKEMAQAYEHSQNVTGLIDAYIREVGASHEFLTMMLKAPSSSIALVGELDALRLGIHVMEQATERLLMPNTVPAKVAAYDR